jgi:hypothetical protein
MSPRAARQFDQKLLELFRARTHELRSYMWPTKGAVPKFTKKRVRNTIEKLRDIAEDDYLKSRDARKLLKQFDYKRQWHTKRGKGFGRTAKKQSFKKWYERKITTKNCVYAFWNKSRCLYVGRTRRGQGRPLSHFDKYWFGQTTRVDVFGFNGRRDVPQFECMLTHKNKPVHAEHKPSSQRYHTPCPVCAGRTRIGDEVRWLFRIR